MHGEPLLLVHGVAGDQEAQQVLHARIVREVVEPVAKPRPVASAVTLAYMSAVRLPLA